MHLSAPAETSINDGINKEVFTLHYSTIDGAVRMINKLGRNALTGKSRHRECLPHCTGETAR
jgi:hypothetical protein